MAAEHHGLPENLITQSSRNHFDHVHDIVKVETIKEEPIEIKWSIENGVCDKSRQEEVEDGKFHEPISSNCEENPRESKPSPTHTEKNTSFETKGSVYVLAAEDQLKKEIKLENTNEDHYDCTDDLLKINAELEMQPLKFEDALDIVYEDIKPEIDRNKFSGNKSHPNTIANIVPHGSSIDFGVGSQQNSTIEEQDETVAGGNNGKQFQCNLSSRSLSQSGHLKTHEITHTKPFQCEICAKSFSKRNALKIHERSHTGEKPYQCNFCLKPFSTREYLKKHNRIHTGEKPFQCNMCPKSFVFSTVLKRHYRTHSGEKPFRCNFCSNSFTESGALKNHERTHTGDKTFQCNLYP